MNALKLIMIIIAFPLVLLFGCMKTAVPIRGNDVLAIDPKGNALPFDKLIVINISEQERNRLIRLRGGILRDGDLMYEAALEVFSRVFLHVNDSAISRPCSDMVINISGSADVETFWGNYVAKTQVDLLTPNNSAVSTFYSEGNSHSDFLLDSNALRNAYILAFNEIVEQMLADNKFMREIKSRSTCRAQ